jgi:hypothetical protein
MSSYRDNPEIKAVMNPELSASFTSRNEASATGKKMIPEAAVKKGSEGAGQCLNCKRETLILIQGAIICLKP